MICINITNLKKSFSLLTSNNNLKYYEYLPSQRFCRLSHLIFYKLNARNNTVLVVSVYIEKTSVWGEV